MSRPGARSLRPAELRAHPGAARSRTAAGMAGPRAPPRGRAGKRRGGGQRGGLGGGGSGGGQRGAVVPGAEPSAGFAEGRSAFSRSCF